MNTLRRRADPDLPISRDFFRKAPQVVWPDGTRELSSDNIGEGKDIPILLRFAQQFAPSGNFDVDCANHDAIIANWNGWLKAERERDPEFRPDLTRFNAEATVWKDTLLWLPNWVSWDTNHPFEIRGIDWQWTELVGSNLKGADLQDSKLQGAHLIESYLGDASFHHADLSMAFLSVTEFENSDLSWANLQGADLEYADLKYCCLDHAKLDFTDLSNARLKGASLREASILGTRLNGTDFSDAEVTSIEYAQFSGIWPLRRNLMRRRYLGIRGIDSSYGNPGFRRDALDQDYIDNKLEKCQLFWRPTWRENVQFFRVTHSRTIGWLVNPIAVFFRALRWRVLPSRIARRLAFWIWSLSDFGRSGIGVMTYVALVIGAIGATYKFALIPDHVRMGDTPGLPTDPWYAAAMGAATLGLTDLMKPIDIIGEVVLFLNALAGLILFGVLVAVMQNKLARRS